MIEPRRVNDLEDPLVDAAPVGITVKASGVDGIGAVS
jgi:hypothetical protein